MPGSGQTYVTPFAVPQPGLGVFAAVIKTSRAPAFTARVLPGAPAVGEDDTRQALPDHGQPETQISLQTPWACRTMPTALTLMPTLIEQQSPPQVDRVDHRQPMTILVSVRLSLDLLHYGIPYW